MKREVQDSVHLQIFFCLYLQLLKSQHEAIKIQGEKLIITHSVLLD